MIEVNGPANIIMLLETMLEDGRIDQKGYDSLIRQAKGTVNYIRLLDNPKNVKWCDVINKETL